MDDAKLTAFLEYAQTVHDSGPVRLDLDGHLLYMILDLVRFAEDGKSWEPVPHTSERELLASIRDEIMAAQERHRVASGIKAAWGRIPT